MRTILALMPVRKALTTVPQLSRMHRFALTLIYCLLLPPQGLLGCRPLKCVLTLTRCPRSTDCHFGTILLARQFIRNFFGVFITTLFHACVAAKQTSHLSSLAQFSYTINALVHSQVHRLFAVVNHHEERDSLNAQKGVVLQTRRIFLCPSITTCLLAVSG